MLKSSLDVRCPNCPQKGKAHKEINGKFSIYFCYGCRNGFTYPTPKHIEEYYRNSYWTSSGFLGNIKDIIFDIFQRRRVSWTTKTILKGIILDVGSGEGKFGTALPQTYKVVNIEPTGSKVKNKSVIKKGFLEWKIDQKFDAVTFWESLEHTPYPQKYLEKAYKLLNNKGRIFIEFPRYNCFESKLFGKNWFHLDLPRHLAHLTDKGVILLLKRSGFKNVNIKSVFSCEYAPWGITVSLLNSINLRATSHIKKSGNLLLFIVLVPITFLSFILEIVLLLMNQSPIALAVAEKNE